MDRFTVVAALRVLPAEWTLTVPVPDMLCLLRTESDGDDLLSVADVAELVKRTPGAIRNWIRTDQLTATKIGKSYRITRDDLSAFLNRNPTANASEAEVGSLTSAEGRMSPGTWREKRRGGAG